MEVRAEVIKLACNQPDKQKVPFRDLWTLGALREAVHRETGYLISTSEIRRILEGCDLKPHRVRIWLKSPDPMFREKVKAVCDVYVNPPAPGDVVLCIDEKPGMQALQHKHRFRPPTIGVAGRCEFEYIRNGTRNLFAAFNPHTGEVFGKVTKRRRADDLMSFMEQVARRHPTGTVTVVWDNLNIHKGQRWVEFNQRHGNRFRFIFTPLHASWCNQVEVWFSILQRRVLKHNSFESVHELAAQVAAFIKHWNDWEAHPFRWKFRGDFISRAA
jgi:transposase